MDLALNNLQRLICHKTQQTNQQTNKAQYHEIILFIINLRHYNKHSRLNDSES